MTENWKENPPQEDLESKLTLYLMGEADEATSAEVEAALSEDDGLRARLEEMQRALELLRAPQLQPVLGVDRRDALRAAATHEQGEPPHGKLLQFPVVRLAAALLVFGGIAAIWSNSGQDLAPANSQVASAPADESKSFALESIGYVADSALEEESEEQALPEFARKSGAAGGAQREGLPALKNEAGGLLDQLGYSGGGLVADGSPPTRDGMPSAGGRYLGPGESVFPGGKTLRFAEVKDAPDTLLALTRTENLYEPSTPLTPTPPSAPGLGKPSGPSMPSVGFSVSPIAPGSIFVAEGENGDMKVLELDGYRLGSDGPETQARSSDKRAKEQRDDDRIEPLDRLGYMADEVDAETIFDFRGLGNGSLSKDGDGPYYFDDFGSNEPPICTLTDGFGRTYYDLDVLKHLRPDSPKETARDMFFRFYGDNPEVYARVEALSTFAADVDTASYPMARNYLVNNQLPPKAAIRTEEFLNYFEYGMAAPTEDDFAVYLQAADSKFGDDGDLLLSIGIKAREVTAAERPAMNLVFVIDKSGSMAGERMQLVKDALMLLVDQIRDTDTIGLVTFDSTGQVVLEPTSGSERYRIRKAIRGLRTGGSTNAGQGLALGYGLAEKVFDVNAINRVVLASDGVANTGQTDQMKILQTVQARAEAKVDLTTLGVGMGNHNDVFLEQLADKGNGSCHYLDDVEEAKRVLVDGFLGTMITVARDVKIQVEFDPEQVLRWRQLGYENRSLAHADFRKDEVDAGEIGSGHEVIALYEIQPNLEADAEANMVTVRLRWKPEGSEEAVEREYQLDLQAAQGRYELASVRLRQMAVVAQYSEVLRRSWHARVDSYPELSMEAQSLAKELSGEAEVVELARMIQRTSELARWAPQQDELSLMLEEARRQRLLEAELAMLGDRGEAEEMLLEVRRQNQLLENRLQEMLQRP